MRKLFDRSAASLVLALFAPVAFATQVEEMQTFIGRAAALALVVVMAIAGVYSLFRQLPDKRAATLQTILNEANQAIHSVEADTLVVECVRKMTDKKIGALIVMDGAKLVGIFTERDALSRVLAAGRDPRDTRVVEVMTTDPYCVSPGMTVGTAMELVTKKRFRHLPIVENGQVQALLSNRDLTHWLVSNRGEEVQDLVELAYRS